MGLENFWQYLVDNGWRLSNFFEDNDGNYECPFCNYTMPHKIGADEVPVFVEVIYCPRCGEIKSEDEEA